MDESDRRIEGDPAGPFSDEGEDVVRIVEGVAIPRRELQFRFSTSSGPGGQHVNKAATRVTLLFDVAGSPSLDEDRRARLLERLASRIDRQGVLQVNVQETRSQWENREIAVARFQTMLAEALTERPTRRPTRPSRAAKERRLADKRRRARTKLDRRRDWVDE